MPRLDAIFVCPIKAAPARSVEVTRVVRRHGIDGDRYAAHAGTFTKPNEVADAGRDVALIEAETIDAVLNEHGLDLSAGQHRRNLATRGLIMRDLANNAWLAIGDEVLLRVDRTCPPCGHLERLVPGSLAALKGRGGLRTTVVRGGLIRVGDLIRVGSRRAFAEETGEAIDVR